MEVIDEQDYKYTYRFSEQTVDTRYYKVESNEKLTKRNARYSFFSREEGETLTTKCNGRKATFEGKYGDDAQYQMEEEKRI